MCVSNSLSSSSFCWGLSWTGFWRTEFMAWSLPKVLREGQPSGSACAGLIFNHHEWLAWHYCGSREGALDPGLVSYAERAFCGCLSKCLWYRQGCASLSPRSPSFKWLIAPSTTVFIQIICSWKRFNLLELISYSCWNTSKCSKRELSKLSPHGACWEGSCHLSPWRAALRFFLTEKSVLFVSVPDTVPQRCSL